MTAYVPLGSGAEYLRGDDIAILCAHSKVEIGHDAVVNENRRTQTIAMFEQPASRIARELRPETEADEILGAAVQHRVALRSV